jgi:hypothetical protein
MPGLNDIKKTTLSNQPSRARRDCAGSSRIVVDYPEIPADIYEIGLVYKIDIADDRAVTVDMTLTTPNCPSAQELPVMVENAVASVAGLPANCALTARRCSTLNSRSAIALEHACSSALSPLTGHAFLERR